MIVVVFLIIVIAVVVFIKNRSNRSIYDDRCVVQALLGRMRREAGKELRERDFDRSRKT